MTNELGVKYPFKACREQFDYYGAGPDGDEESGHYIVATGANLYIEDRGDFYFIQAYNARDPFLEYTYRKSELGRLATEIGIWFHKAEAEHFDKALSSVEYLNRKDFFLYPPGEKNWREDVRDLSECDREDDANLKWSAITTGGLELLFQEVGDNMYLYFSDPVKKPILEMQFSKEELGDFGKHALQYLEEAKDECDEYYQDEKEDETVTDEKEELYLAHIRYEREPRRERVYYLKATSTRDASNKVQDAWTVADEFYMKVTRLPAPIHTLRNQRLIPDEPPGIGAGLEEAPK